MDVIDYTKMMNSYKQEQPARFQLGTRALSRQAGGGATQPGSMGGGKVSTSEGEVLVHDLQYNNTNSKRILMSTFDAKLDLQSCVQKSTHLMGDYYKVITLTVYTINANEEKAGVHLVVYGRHLVNTATKKRNDHQ
jgi:hypothetical protein